MTTQTPKPPENQSENPNDKYEQQDNQSRPNAVVQGASKFFGILTYRHATRHYRQIKPALNTIEDSVKSLNHKKEVEYPCPFCYGSSIRYNEPQKYYDCPACSSIFLDSEHKNDALLKDFLHNHARAIYLDGKEVENSAYYHHGAFSDSSPVILRRIDTYYVLSKIMLIVAIIMFYNALTNALNLNLFLVVLCFLAFSVALIYSLLLAYKAYCLGTRQMFIGTVEHIAEFIKRHHFKYFLNIGKRKDINLLEYIAEYEQDEQEQKRLAQQSADDEANENEWVQEKNASEIA